MMYFYRRIRRMREDNSFSLFVSPHPGEGEGTPSPSHTTSTGPMFFTGDTPVTDPRSLPRGYPSQIQMGIPRPGPDGRGTLVRDGVPPPPPTGQD